MKLVYAIYDFHKFKGDEHLSYSGHLFFSSAEKLNELCTWDRKNSVVCTQLVPDDEEVDCVPENY